MKVYLTKLEIPQLIRTSDGYMLFHLYEEVLSLFEFDNIEEAKKAYENALSFFKLHQEQQLKVGI